MSTLSQSFAARRRSVLAVALVLILAASLVVADAAGRNEPAAAAGGVTGIDIASYQHPGGAAIDWNQVRGAGHSFAYVKATESTTYLNPYFFGDWGGAASVGMYRGAYHYARPALPLSTAQAQARYFVSKTGSMGGPLDLPPMLDMEETGGLGPADLVAWTHTFMQEVQLLTGRVPVLYTGYYFWLGQLGGTTSLSGYRLWLPQYTSNPAPSQVPSAWGTWTFWQHSSTGSVPGIIGNVDMNRFCCPIENLAAMAGSGGAAVGNPFGGVDGASLVPGSAQISGWVIDPDTTGSVPIHVYVDGRWGGAFTANKSRPDVGAAYPGFGNLHGFSVGVPSGGGTHQVCAYAINVGSGTTNPLLGCRTVVPNPIGAIDSAISPTSGALSVAGWAIDPDTTAPIDVHVYVDGRWTRSVRASDDRPDVGDLYPTAGDAHGWHLDLAGVGGGTRQVCVYAINVGAGTTNPLLGCRNVSVLSATPTGTVDNARAVFGAIEISGWTLDPDTAGPIDVHLYVDGAWGGSTVADRSRPDVGEVYPLYGPLHGYAARVEGVGAGRHTICAYAINTGSGSGNPLLGCRTVTVSGDPTGNLDSVSTATGLRVSGWTVDPDTTSPIDVHVYVDGRWWAQGRANRNRPDVGVAYPAYGSAHGYELDVPIPADGQHQVCVFAISAGPGVNTRLGCRNALVSRVPVGSVDSVERTTDSVRIQGWTFDPDSGAAVQVHVYVDGAWGGAFVADGHRPDVAAVHPEAGPNRGFDAMVPVGAGPHQVCVYAINLGLGATNPLLACRTA